MQRFPVAPKIKAATTGGTLGAVAAGIIDWVLAYYVFKGGNPPQVVQAEIYAVIPGVLAGLPAFIAGYRAPHQDRPDPVVAVPPGKAGM